MPPMIGKFNETGAVKGRGETRHKIERLLARVGFIRLPRKGAPISADNYCLPLPNQDEAVGLTRLYMIISRFGHHRYLELSFDQWTICLPALSCSKDEPIYELKQYINTEVVHCRIAKRDGRQEPASLVEGNSQVLDQQLVEISLHLPFNLVF